MARPTLVCEFSPGSVPLSTSRAWVDISERVISAEWTWGAERDGSDFPGEATIVLDNYDRLFDPENTSGTYTGQLVPRVPFRLRATGDVTGDLFYGFVEDGWEQEFFPPDDGICTVRLVDLLTVLDGYTLPGVFEAAVLALNPLDYWPLTSEGCTDLGSTPTPGTPDENPTFGAAELFAGLGPSVELDGEHQRVDISRSILNFDHFNATAMACFQTDLAAESNTQHPIFTESNGNPITIVKTFNFFIHTDGKLRFITIDHGVGWARGTLAEVNDGAPHIVFCVADLDGANSAGIAVDTATLTDNDVLVAFDPGGNGTAIGGTPFAKRGYTLNFFPGLIGHVAIWDAVLTEANRQAILDALPCLDGDRSDEQIAWALDQIGVPAGLRNLDQGRSIMGPAYTAGADALTFIRDVTATEQGSFYVDHSDGGKLRFTQRYTAFEATRSTVSQATFSDDPTESFDDVVRVEPDDVVVEANGVRTVINQATVAWRGGQETHEDPTSIAAYGPRGRTVDTQAANANQARGLAQWIVTLEAEPRTRIRELGLNPAAAEDAFTAAIGLRPHDLITYRSQPAETGSVIERSLLVKGVAHSVEDMEWGVSLFTDSTPADAVTLFTLGTSELDGTDVLAF